MPKLFLTILPFSIVKGELQILLKDGTLPSIQIDNVASLDELASASFSTFTGISQEKWYQEQLYSFSYPSKVVISYFMLVSEDQISDKSKCVGLHEAVGEDKELVEYALQRLRWKVEYTNLVYSLLPKEFTLSQLQSMYEAILGKNLDKRNFRKKILSLKIVKASGKMKKGVQARPASLYEFVSRKPTIVKVF